MNTNILREKLRCGQPSFGTWITLGDPTAARVLARAGFDWLTVDLEHAPIDWSRAAVLFATIADAGCVPLCRVPEGSIVCVKRALDAGAFGIVVPMVESVRQAQAAVAAAKYPPCGVRSVGGPLAALNFGLTPSEYYAIANDQILVVVQIESPAGVEHAKAIAAESGCDAVFIGPNDLRFTLRTRLGREPTNEEFEHTVAKVLAAARDAGVPCGMHTSNATAAKQRAAQGMQLLAVGSDLSLLNAGIAAAMRELGKAEVDRGY